MAGRLVKTAAASGRLRARDDRAKLARPFSKRLCRQARRLASRYRFLVEPEGEARFLARPMEYPEVVGVGETPHEALQNAVDLASTAVVVLLETGRNPPEPWAG